MLRSKKLLSFVMVALLATACLYFAKPATGASTKRVTCVINMVVETKGSGGGVSTTSYQKEFSLTDGQTISDDFSTATRFRFMDAGLTKVAGEWVMDVSWFADTSVFNAVDLSTQVAIANGQKTNKSAGRHSFFTSGQEVTTTYSIVCTLN